MKLIIKSKKRYINEVVELLGISELKWKKEWGKKPNFSVLRINDQEIHYTFDKNHESVEKYLLVKFQDKIKINK